MKPSIPGLGVLERFDDIFLLGKFLLPDGFIDSNDILPDDTSCANVQMSIIDE